MAPVKYHTNTTTYNMILTVPTFRILTRIFLRTYLHYGTNTTLTIDLCYLHCLEPVSEIPILDRKEFVVIHLWRNLNWKFLILVLSVHNLASKLIE